jgi:hypothetical protein
MTFRKSPLDDLSQIFEVQSSATLRTGHTSSLSNLRGARKSWTFLRQVTGQKKNHAILLQSKMVISPWFNVQTKHEKRRDSLAGKQHKLAKSEEKHRCSIKKAVKKTCQDGDQSWVNTPLDITVGGSNMK